MRIGLPPMGFTVLEPHGLSPLHPLYHTAVLTSLYVRARLEVHPG